MNDYFTIKRASFFEVFFENSREAGDVHVTLYDRGFRDALNLVREHFAGAAGCEGTVSYCDNLVSQMEIEE